MVKTPSLFIHTQTALFKFRVKQKSQPSWPLDMPAIGCLKGRVRGRSHPWWEPYPKSVIAEKAGPVAQADILKRWQEPAGSLCSHGMLQESFRLLWWDTTYPIHCHQLSVAPASPSPIKALTYGWVADRTPPSCAVWAQRHHRRCTACISCRNLNISIHNLMRCSQGFSYIVSYSWTLPLQRPVNYKNSCV